MTFEQSKINISNLDFSIKSDASFNFDLIEEGVRLILAGIGEDIHRDGIKKTPYRVAKMYKELCSNSNSHLSDKDLTTFSENVTGQIIAVKDIYFSTICEHHLLPFFGQAHIAYIPKTNKIAGLSKLARIVDFYAKRLQVQERMTYEIAQAVANLLDAKGVLVLLQAEHLCMSIRGTNKPGTKTNTMLAQGILETDINARNEALNLLRM